jgi:hypothetical protein
VDGSEEVGGLVGHNDNYISDSYSTGNVTGTHRVGGLVGYNWYTVTNSYATGSVTGTGNYTGGLLGYNHWAYVSYCYATGSVTGNNHVGGLVGYSWGTESRNGYVHDCYATGSATGTQCIGGLMGLNSYADVYNSYSIGSVAGDTYVGGLIGRNQEGGTVSDSFWDTETSGTGASAEGTGKTTEEMYDITTFSDAWWTITDVAPGVADDYYTWNIVDGEAYPFLGWQDVS